MINGFSSAKTDSGRLPTVDAGHGGLSGEPWRIHLVSALLALADFVAVPLACGIGSLLYGSPLFEEVRHRADWDGGVFFLFSLVLGGVLVFNLSWLGLYRRGMSLLNVEEDVLFLQGFLLTTVLALSFSFLLRDLPISRIALLIGVILTPPLALAFRRGVWHLISRVAARGWARTPVLILGAGETGRQLADRILRNAQLGLNPVGFLDDALARQPRAAVEGPGKHWTLPVLGRSDDIIRQAGVGGVRVLFVAIPSIGSERLEELREMCHVLDVNCYHVPLCSGSTLRRFDMTLIGDIPVICERTAVRQTSHQLVKRAMDVVLSALALVVFSPLMLLAVVLIKLGSKGPVLFAQTRVGEKGRPFQFYKFRTMHADGNDYQTKEEALASNRVFPTGAFLRRTSIDELPQFYNVLRGDMSLVGPRPEMPHVVENYGPLEHERLQIRPGLTGLWQISPDRNSPIHENIDYDLYYVYNQSFLLDLVILARTAFALLSGR